MLLHFIREHLTRLLLYLYLFCICFLFPPNVYSALLNASFVYITSFICLHNKWLIMAELTFSGNKIQFISTEC